MGHSKSVHRGGPGVSPHVSRRDILRGLSAASLFGVLAPGAVLARGLVQGAARKARVGKRVIVVGAGAFGAFSALSLLRRGARVTLLDAWGPGNSRASSGGETRVIRGVYGSDRIYTQMAARAFQLWAENEKRWRTKLYRRTGALWMIADEGTFVRDSMPLLRESHFP